MGPTVEDLRRQLAAAGGFVYVHPVDGASDHRLREINGQLRAEEGVDPRPTFCLTCDCRFDDIERDLPAAFVIVEFTVGTLATAYPFCRACYQGKNENELIARVLQHHSREREFWPWRAGRERHPDERMKGTDSNEVLKHALVECFQRVANDLAPHPYRGREVVDAGVVFLFLSMLCEFWENFPEGSDQIMPTFLRDLNRVVKRARQGRYDGDGGEDSHD